MPPVVIDLQKTEDLRDVVHRAVEALADGKLVAFPIEAVYALGASALNEEAVDRLMAIRQHDADALTLAIKSADDALDYVPDMAPLGQRLARRCWPGPVTLVLDDAHPESVISQLPARVRAVVAPTGTVGLRVPSHPVLLSVLRLSAGPVALTDAGRGGAGDASTADEVLATLGDQVDLVLDDGRSRHAKPASVVRIVDNKFDLVRTGAYNEEALRRLSGKMILLVCTGNTCRSPMAEVLLRHHLSHRLKCKGDELESRGVTVASAGIAAMAGGGPSPEAVAVAQERNLDLSLHQSQPLNDDLVRYADYILTMTRGHRDALIAQWPHAAPRTHLLRRDGGEISDPIGGPAEMYRGCAAQIDEHLQAWIDELAADSN